MEPKDSKNLQTLDKALKTLTCFSRQRPEWGITELSQQLELSKSIVHRIVSTLENWGFLEQNPVSKKYRLGIKLFELGSLVSGELEIRRHALPVMQELADFSGETVNLTIVDRPSYEGVCIETVDSNQSVKFSTRVGTTMPLHWGASHKILMAFLSDTEINIIINRKGLSPLTEHTITKAELLKEELKKIRRQGYAVSREEVDLGAAAVAAPIFDQHGQITAGLTVVGPLYRMQPKKLEMLIDRVRAAARAITAKIGGRDWAGTNDKC